MPREILVGFGVDVDAVAGWYAPNHLSFSQLTSQGQARLIRGRRLPQRHLKGTFSSVVINRRLSQSRLAAKGLYAGEVGVPRLLKLFDKYNIKTTWFIPGHSLETFPEQMASVRDAGHEM